MIRTFFAYLIGVKPLYRIKKPQRLLWEGGIIFIALTLAMFRTSDTEFADVAFDLYLVALLLLVAYCVRTTVKILYFRHLCARRWHGKKGRPGTGEWYKEATILRLNEVRDTEVRYLPLEHQQGWQCYDILVDGLSGYKGKRTYQQVHTVIEITLSRELPNVVFDSKRAYGRQFRRAFLAQQKVSFEGHFDTFFDSYVPQSYQIDTFSFLSPEVLYAMIEFHTPCDIEIVGNKLLCYAPFVEDAALPAFKQDALNLYTRLADNIDTYHDSYLVEGDPRVSVAPFAKTLLQNPLSFIGLTVLFGIGSAGLVWVAIDAREPGVLLNDLSFFVIISFVALVGWAFHTHAKNRKAEQDFRVYVKSHGNTTPRKNENEESQPLQRDIKQL